MANGGEGRVGAAESQEVARLRKAVGDLQAQCNVLGSRLGECQERLRAANIANAIKRVELLFRVLENGEWFGREYLEECAREIREMLTLPEDGREDKEGMEDKCDGNG